MASYQRIALYILFDSLERDLSAKIASVASNMEESVLTPEESSKAVARLDFSSKENQANSHATLINNLDLGDKLSIISRIKEHLSYEDGKYYNSIIQSLSRAIPTRNAIMHGRPLTATEYSIGFALANELVKKRSFWPELVRTYTEFNENPDAVVGRSIQLLDDNNLQETLNNLPPPDYDDTGFIPRPELEKELRKKILSRHPVVTVLGDGGNGKTALTLQVLYGLIDSQDHNFDAIVWASAKSSVLSGRAIIHLEDAITDSLGIFREVADLLEPGNAPPIDRVKKLMADNKILLVIDNLETVLDRSIAEFAEDIPGESKLVLTSRVPLGSDLTVQVEGFSREDSLKYYYRMADVLSNGALKRISKGQLEEHFQKLGNKPLLIKWFALGVDSGLSPESITANPTIALKFCMENVLGRLSEDAKYMASLLTMLVQSLSITVLEFIGKLNAAQAENAISELSRFGIAEFDDSETGDRRYRIKPFARAYITKALPFEEAASKAVMAKFRQVSAAYQYESAGRLRDRYNPRNFVVSTPSQAIAARKLRHAITLVHSGDIDAAEDILVDLKVTFPTYFEVHRVEAYIAQRSGDISRSRTAFETALAVDETQPQLHFFFAQFLTIIYGDFSTASDHYLKAHELDKSSIQVLLEAARISFFHHEFDNASNYLKLARELPQLGEKSRIKLLDLNAQYFVRKAEFEFSKGNVHAAEALLIELAQFLEQSDIVDFDSLFVRHLRKAEAFIESVDKITASSSDGSLSRLQKYISALPNPAASESDEGRIIEKRFHVGKKKPNSVHDSYLFLKDYFGEETYLAKSSISEHLWREISAGASVMYEVAQDKFMRKSAVNVTLV